MGNHEKWWIFANYIFLSSFCDLGLRYDFVFYYSYIGFLQYMMLDSRPWRNKLLLVYFITTFLWIRVFLILACACSRNYYFSFGVLRPLLREKWFIYSIGAFDRWAILNKKPVSTRLGDRDVRKVIPNSGMCSIPFYRFNQWKPSGA